MNKKILTLLAIFLVVISVASVCAVELTTESHFAGKFKMNITQADTVQSFNDSNNGGNTYLSKSAWTVNDNISAFYYGKSMDKVVSELKSNSAFLNDPKTDGNLTILEDTTSPEGASYALKYFVGVSSGNDTVFVGSNDLNLAKDYAKTIVF